MCLTSRFSYPQAQSWSSSSRLSPSPSNAPSSRTLLSDHPDGPEALESSFDPKHFTLPKCWSIQLVICDNLPTLTETGPELKAFLFQVLRNDEEIQASDGAFFPLPDSVHIGLPGTDYFRQAVLVYHRPESQRLKRGPQGSKILELQADGNFLRFQLMETVSRLNKPEEAVMFDTRKIQWTYLDCKLSNHDRIRQKHLYRQLSGRIGFRRGFVLAMLLKKTKSAMRPCPGPPPKHRYGDLVAVPGLRLNLAKHHRARTNSNAATLEGEMVDELSLTASESESDETSSDEGDDLMNHSHQEGFGRHSARTHSHDIRTQLDQLRAEVDELEEKIEEQKLIEREESQSEAYTIAQIVSDERREDLREKKSELYKLLRQASGGRKRKNQSDSDDDDGFHRFEGDERVWRKRKRVDRMFRA